LQNDPQREKRVQKHIMPQDSNKANNDGKAEKRRYQRAHSHIVAASEVGDGIDAYPLSKEEPPRIR
jgi:hypothetical protein